MGARLRGRSNSLPPSKACAGYALRLLHRPVLLEGLSCSVQHQACRSALRCLFLPRRRSKKKRKDDGAGAKDAKETVENLLSWMELAVEEDQKANEEGGFDAKWGGAGRAAAAVCHGCGGRCWRMTCLKAGLRQMQGCAFPQLFCLQRAPPLEAVGNLCKTSCLPGPPQGGLPSTS